MAAHGKTPQIAVGQRRVGRQNHHDGTVNIGLQCFEILYALSIQPQIATIVRLHQDTDRIAALLFRQHAGTGADTALVAEGDCAGSSPDRALGNRAVRGGLDGLQHLLHGGEGLANIVQTAVIGLAHHGIQRGDALIARLRQGPAVHRLDGAADRQRVGQQDRRLDLAQFDKLRGACQLAKAVEHSKAGRNLVLKRIAIMRQDRRHPGADALALTDRDMADAHAGHIGDRVQRAGRQGSGGDAEITGAVRMCHCCWCPMGRGGKPSARRRQKKRGRVPPLPVCACLFRRFSG